ncbi:hypothetical protein ACFFHC_11545 [Kytococcus schroeteri]|nr:hypothetical protein [Kytococcus schroeteri]
MTLHDGRNGMDPTPMVADWASRVWARLLSTQSTSAIIAELAAAIREARDFRTHEPSDVEPGRLYHERMDSAVREARQQATARLTMGPGSRNRHRFILAMTIAACTVALIAADYVLEHHFDPTPSTALTLFLLGGILFLLLIVIAQMATLIASAGYREWKDKAEVDALVRRLPDRLEEHGYWEEARELHAHMEWQRRRTPHPARTAPKSKRGVRRITLRRGPLR